ncbi:MAG: NAD(P)H-dependent oxidoreductase subunit E [Elusimicrobiota bacterium]|nr:NAD(P)H-dependent oxidoreductase subunit E [Elusimicrobiota bacterium]
MYDSEPILKGILEKYSKNPTKLIAILQDIQKEFKYLPKEALVFTAIELKLSPAKVFGVATFFSHFTLTKKGKNIIKVCDGTACHVKRSGDIIDSLRKRFNLTSDKITSDDGLMTLETVSCLGACGLAPVVLVNDEVYGEMTVEKINTIIDNFIKK